MSSEERGFKHDRESLVRMFRKNLINQEPFQYMLEEESIFWMDDLDLTSSMVIKTIKSIKEDDDEVELLTVWRDDDDKDFMEGLFTKTLAQGDENESLIKEGAQNWELERIALTDKILMKMALAEAKMLSKHSAKGYTKRVHRANLNITALIKVTVSSTES